MPTSQGIVGQEIIPQVPGEASTITLSGADKSGVWLHEFCTDRVFRLCSVPVDLMKSLAIMTGRFGDIIAEHNIYPQQHRDGRLLLMTF